MHCNRSIPNLILAIALCAFGSTGALAQYEPNDNYSTFVLSYQSSKFSSPICINGECHESVSGPAVVYARQIFQNFALGMAGSQLQSSAKSSSVTSTNVSVFLQAIAGMGPGFDIGASVAGLNTSTELCTVIPNACSSASDIGTDLGVFGKAFITEGKTLSLTLAYDAIYYQKLPNESIIGLSLVGILAKHHRLALSVSSVRDQSGNEISGGLGFGYSYIVYY